MSLRFMAVVLLVASWSATAVAGEASEVVVRVPRVPRALAAGGHERTVVVLEHRGAVLVPGWDRAADRRSSIVYGAGLARLEVPAFSRGDAAWRQVVACVQDRFARFDLEVRDTPPAGPDYVLAVVGGDPSLLGYPARVAGVAPYSGGVIPGAVAFVFERTITDLEELCEVTAHEVGHVLGLDHAYLCEDPMSYLDGCGTKTFQDTDASCGELAPRPCGDGQPTQNSVRHLAGVLGWAPAEEAAEPEAVPEPEPDTEMETETETETETDTDTDTAHDPQAAPSIELLSPARGDRLHGDDWIVIAARVVADDGVAAVQLTWSNPRADDDLVIDCADPPRDLPVACERDGDLVVFVLHVGRGRRTFSIRAVDKRGVVSETDPVHIRLR